MGGGGTRHRTSMVNKGKNEGKKNEVGEETVKQFERDRRS
jgi:hypothetical protein